MAVVSWGRKRTASIAAPAAARTAPERGCARSVSRSGVEASFVSEHAAAGPADTAALQVSWVGKKSFFIGFYFLFGHPPARGGWPIFGLAEGRVISPGGKTRRRRWW